MKTVKLIQIDEDCIAIFPAGDEGKKYFRDRPDLFVETKRTVAGKEVTCFCIGTGKKLTFAAAEYFMTAEQKVIRLSYYSAGMPGRISNSIPFEV